MPEKTSLEKSKMKKRQACNSKLDGLHHLHVDLATAQNRPQCINGCGTSMYFCKMHKEFYCTNCILDHSQTYLQDNRNVEK